MACGISPYVQKIAEGLVQDQGLEVAVLTSDDEAVDVTVAKGYAVYPRIKKWRWWRAWGICREILRLEPDVVHVQNLTIKYFGVHSVTMSVIVPLLKQLAPQVRVVVMQHDIAIGQRWFRWRYLPLLKAADAIMVSNNRDFQAIVDLGVESSKIMQSSISTYVALVRAEPQQKAAARQSWGIDPEALCCVYFGFVLPGRNVEVLIRALALLRDQGEKVHGLILGGAHAKAPEYYEQCRQLARDIRMDEVMSWTGYADDGQIADALAAADIFVSLLERGADMRNTSILTGILAELPVITAENRRYYVDKQLEALGCRMVDPHDPVGLAKALRDMRQAPPSREQLAQAAEQVRPERVWAEHVESIKAVYRGQV